MLPHRKQRTNKKQAHCHAKIVAHCASMYSIKNLAGAKEAQKMYQIIHQPGLQEFKQQIRDNEIKKITIRDVGIAKDVFGADIRSIKGKTVRKIPKALCIN